MLPVVITQHQDLILTELKKFMTVACRGQIDDLNFDHPAVLERLTYHLRLFMCKCYYNDLMATAEEREDGYEAVIFTLFPKFQPEIQRGRYENLSQVFEELYGSEPLIVDGREYGSYGHLSEMFWSRLAQVIFSLETEEEDSTDRYLNHFARQPTAVMFNCLAHLQV